jgi:dTDP-4-dehydrorhamnose reductase
MTNNYRNFIPELWGGIECSYNRVGDCFFDQLDFSNHYKRGEKDIALIAELGIKKIRYPILWEYHQPFENITIDWSWTEKQLNALAQNNITPIAGLLHHGSGPMFTNLADEKFSKRFSEYAKLVARKFPEIKYYTPINEPLTTARFSGLYGLWYPHGKDDKSFAVMFLNQLKGIVLAMREIRKINSEAKLIQTEDLGKTYCTPALQYQADFENERRWLTFDFLCGKFDEHHPLWNFFIKADISKKDLLFFQNNPCAPDIIGINHYLTSERFLDDDVDQYPPQYHGGNHRQIYADVEAIRIKHNKLHGLFWLLLETWKRFNLDMALTEIHVHCTREEQMRWLKEKMNLASTCLNHGIPIQAITMWSLLGAFGWNKLLTSQPFIYESGIFDLSFGEPRSTALADIVKHYAVNKPYTHPVLDQPAWWTRADRFIKKNDREPFVFNISSQNVLIISNNSNLFLAECFKFYCKQRGILYQVIQHTDNDDATEALIKTSNPWAIINCELLENEKSVNRLQNLIFKASKKCEQHFRMIGFISPWLELLESPDKVLLIRCYLEEHPLFAEIEHSYLGNPAQLNSILLSYHYISVFVNASLDLMIDNCVGIWETPKIYSPTIQDVIEENMMQ